MKKLPSFEKYNVKRLIYSATNELVDFYGGEIFLGQMMQFSAFSGEKNENVSWHKTIYPSMLNLSVNDLLPAEYRKASNLSLCWDNESDPDEFILTLEQDVSVADTKALVSCLYTQNNGEQPSKPLYLSEGRILHFGGGINLVLTREKLIEKDNTPEWVDILFAANKILKGAQTGTVFPSARLMGVQNVEEV